MSTVIRPEISTKSKWHLERHRYYELKHFVMQCPSWRKELLDLDGWKARDLDIFVGQLPGNPTEQTAICRAFFQNRIEMLEKASKETDEFIGPRILEGVITGKSYDILNAISRIPCCKDVYYELYRKFFYILSGLRQ